MFEFFFFFSNIFYYLKFRSYHSTGATPGCCEVHHYQLVIIALEQVIKVLLQRKRVKINLP